jgi:hypothetical protein
MTKGQIMTDRGTDAALERLEIERSAWFAKLEVAGAMDANQPGFWGDQSLRDLIVHLNFWQSWKNARLQARGESVSHPWPRELDEISDGDEQVDAINAWAQEQAAGQSISQVIAESHRLWNEQYALIEALPADVRSDPDRFPMFEGHSLDELLIDGSYFEHYHDEHGPELAQLTS